MTCSFIIPLKIDNHLFKIFGYHKSYHDYSINHNVSEFSQLYLISVCLKYYSKDSDVVNILGFHSEVFDVNILHVNTLKMKKVILRMANLYPSLTYLL